ncbi:hypothetical protein HNQ80_000084 [Anaerosolibacter carboniphilus]|uniref:PrcB C-terminal domain-containing protein n=1 Tax=Anaerosolibacter carboniphilus TaxID=1417629 RepID=A0A841KV13_9FIRM|nr:hypothetical protein [Anaerosolibacter carboniphilus]MBB6214015.1 hypothetical protein [Anaerosolibacter carboniphilus]
MKKLLLFFILGMISMFGLIGCTEDELTSNMKDFKIIYDVKQLEPEVQEWIQTTQGSTGIYKNQFTCGSFILISLGDHQEHLIKDIKVKKDNYGYIFNITLKESIPDRQPLDHMLVSPIILETSAADDTARYDVKVIYQ